MLRSTKTTALVALAAAVLPATLAHAAVMAPYTETFNDGVADMFASTTQGSATATSGFSVVDNEYRMDLTKSSQTAGNAEGLAGIEVSNLGSATNADFTYTTQGTLDAPASGTTDTLSRFGVRFLADSATGDANSYFVDVRLSDGVVRLIEFTGSSAASVGTVTGSPLGTVTAGETLDFTVAATYAGSTPTFAINVSDGTSTANIAFTDTSARTGQFFGYRGSTTSGSSTGTRLQVDYDNFQIIPEPASLALLGLGGLMLLPRRQR